MTITKKEALEALNEGRLVLNFTGQGYSRAYQGKFNKYTISMLVKSSDEREVERFGNYQFIDINHHIAPWITEIGYYRRSDEVLAISVFGMSQEFEAKYNLVQVLFDKHNPDYTSLVNKIKVLGY